MVFILSDTSLSLWDPEDGPQWRNGCIRHSTKKDARQLPQPLTTPLGSNAVGEGGSDPRSPHHLLSNFPDSRAAGFEAVRKYRVVITIRGSESDLGSKSGSAFASHVILDKLLSLPGPQLPNV